MKLPSHTILLCYIAAVGRIQKMIEAEPTDSQHAMSWLQAMININTVYEGMTGIPYRVIDPNMHCLGIGRQVWRLYHAVQLLAEWRFVSGTDVTERAVMTAFNEIGDEGFGNDTIFTCDNVSPAAQRAMLNTPFFDDGLPGWIVEGVGTESPTMFVITGSVGVTAERLPENVRFNQELQIWDVVR